MMNLAYAHWRGANEVYMLQSSTAYAEMINLCRFRLNQTTPSTQRIFELAQGKTATQSSEIGLPFGPADGLASKAVDGNTDGNWNNGSVTHTACGTDASNECQGSKNPWWKVDLGAEYEISKVEIWNRTDCCQERLSNFNVWTSPTTGGWTEFSNGSHFYKAGEQYPLTFRGRQKARYVVILIDNPKGFLSLAEVKVFGSK
jgi:hypothetical protein